MLSCSVKLALTYITNRQGETRFKSAGASSACSGSYVHLRKSPLLHELPTLYYPPEWRLGCGGRYSDSVRG